MNQATHCLDAGQLNGAKLAWTSSIMTATAQAFLSEIITAPETVQREALDFLVFLKTRHQVDEAAISSLLPLAGTAWESDWNTPEEDAAWQDL